MYKNYEKRVKEFITEMTNPSSQIVITDITEKVNNCRQELMNESKMQKPFIFKGYTNEQDRINDTIRNHKLLFNLPDYPDPRKNKSASKDKDNSFKDIPPKINFHIFENENEKNKTILTTPLKKDNPNLSLDASRRTGKMNRLKYSYKKRMSTTEKNKIKALIKKDSILQPQMRFTARTDLERVYDVLNGDYIKVNEREIIERQLKHINLYNYKKPKELLKADKSESFGEDELEEKMKNEKSPNKDKKRSKNIKNIYGPSNVYYEARNNDRKIWARKDNLNKEARGLLSSYHFKTHFKATEEIAEYKANENKTNIKESCFLLPHLLPKNYRYRISNTENNSNTINNSISKSVKHKKAFDYSKLEDTRKIFNFDEEHEKDEIIEKNDESNYNIVNNPILMGNKLDIDPHSLKILSKLAFKPKLNEDDENSIDNNDINLLNSVKEKDYDKNKKKDTTNLNQVAKKILNECNVYTQKSKFNNSSHKSKGGKTMITKGMTVEEFENKYNLNI